MDEAKEAISIGVLENLQKGVKIVWADETKRIIGHIGFSLRLYFSIYPDKITRRNFVNNAIDLDHVAAADFKMLMYTHHASPHRHPFDNPGDSLCKRHGNLSDKTMLKPDPRTKD
ncbi:hypothetical protein B0H15DRAFT_806069 [Mycena belliarum]|uniref:Uncharacterized protein n=1 Tax=Mycena belliarum TaxID=1033014 RepID=A0AAD6TSR9_9AGAR|nr:hypothetical protein B0H15DRAFT_806069 [Mycena belliae]